MSGLTPIHKSMAPPSPPKKASELPSTTIASQTVDIWRSTTHSLPSEPFGKGHVIFVRHGHGTHISDGFYNASSTGPRQAELTEKGKQQAKDAADTIKKLVNGPFLSITSPLLRTVQTSEVLVEAGVPVIDEFQKHEAVIEQGSGPHEGQPYDPNITEANGLWKGEGSKSVQQRVKVWINKWLLGQPDKQNVLIVTHQAIMKAIEPNATDAVPCEVRVYSKDQLRSLMQ